MEIIGTIYKILRTEEVTFGDGTKKTKGGFVIMREGEYAKPVAFELFGEERLELLNGLNIGTPVKVNFIANSREGKDGRYYTTLRCTNVFPFVDMASSNHTRTTTAASGSWTPTSNTLPPEQQSAGLSPNEALPFENDLPFL